MLTDPASLAYRAEDVRELDRLTIEEHGHPGIRLMSRAARATFNHLGFLWPETRRLTVFCGTGNNGGDGFLIAAYARQKGIDATVYQLGNAENIRGDALTAKNYALENGVKLLAYEPSLSIVADVVVDAMLGTGLQREVSGDYAQAIENINNQQSPVLAVDIPSGLCSDTGQIRGTVVQADHTVTFIGIKQGCLTGQGPEYCGAIHYENLNVPLEVFDAVAPQSYRLSLESECKALPRRARVSHKGTNGRVLIVGGECGYGGAVIMAAAAAGRSGAGLVSVATRQQTIAGLLSRCPEAMGREVKSGLELGPLIYNADVLAIGPGLGVGSWAEQMMQPASAAQKPMVVDADALNLLAAQPPYMPQHCDNWILTPHPGEAARLLGVTAEEIQADRFAAVRSLQHRYGGVVVLKGAGTLIADGSLTYISEYGNPGMGSGGMGDVLSGVLVALLAQGLSLSEAARLGVCVHSAAADRAVIDGGEIGLLATDLLPYIRQRLNRI